MKTARRPKINVGQIVTLNRTIPAYDSKPFVSTDTALRVAGMNGRGSARDPWRIMVGDGCHFWHVNPEDIASVSW